jgi:hypothetical protein
MAVTYLPLFYHILVVTIPPIQSGKLSERTMPANGTLTQMAKDAGFDSVKLYVESLIKTHKTAFKAALAVGVYPNTIRYHLNKPTTTKAKSA